RTEETGGSSGSLATISSWTWRRLFPAAASRSSSSSLTWGATMRSVVRLKEPSLSRSPIKKLWRATHGTGGLDAVVGLAFGELEHAGAIGEEGGEAGGEVESAGALLGEACDEGDGGGALGSSQPRQLGQERLVVEGSERRQERLHRSCILRSTVRTGPDRDPFTATRRCARFSLTGRAALVPESVARTQ